MRLMRLMRLETSPEISEFVEVLSLLRAQDIDFQGPFRTSKGQFVVRIQDQVVVESELLDLFGSGQLNRAGIAALLRRLRVH